MKKRFGNRLDGASRWRGAASIEVVLIVPLVVLLIAVLWYGWRLGWARTNVKAAASAGVRAASQQISTQLARQRAEQVVISDLGTTNVNCLNLAMDFDLSQFARPAGTPAEVSTQVSCTVSLADLLLPGIPGSVRIDVSSTERLDTYRERRP